MNIRNTVDPVALESEIASLRARLQEAEELRHAISHGEVDAFVIGPSDDSKRVLLLSGAYARYRQLVEEMAQGAVTVARNGDIMFANQAFAVLLKLSAPDLLRVPLQRFIAAADRDSVAALLARRAPLHELKVALACSDGSERRVRVSLVSSSDDFSTLLVTERSAEDEEAGQTLDAIRSGAVDALVVGDQSVVMLDSAQRFYHTAVERMQQGVVIVGAQGDISYANQRMCTMLGVQRARLAGASLLRVVVNDDRPTLKSLLGAPQHGASAQAEIRMCKANGDIFATMVTVAAVADGQKMCLVSDMSLQKRHEATDERTRKFLGMMAHEFRNILGPIRNAVEYMQRVETLDPESRKMVDVVDRQSTRLLALVEDLRRINPKE